MRKRLYVCKQMRGSQMREAQITNDGSTNQKMCWYHHQSLVNIVPPPLDRSFSLLFLVCLTRLLPRIISLALPRQPPPLHALIVPEGRRRRGGGMTDIIYGCYIGYQIGYHTKVKGLFY